jgi:hypothetical protein
MDKLNFNIYNNKGRNLIITGGFLFFLINLFTINPGKASFRSVN